MTLLEILIGALIFFFSFGLGFIIFVKNPHSATHRLFFLLSIIIDIYIVVNFLSIHPPLATPENQLFWIRMVMVVTSFIGPLTLLLVHTFPKDHITLKKYYLMFLTILMVSSALASASPLVFRSLMHHEGALLPVPLPGPGMPIFFVDFVGMFATSVAILLKRFRKEKGEDKVRYFYLLFGIILSFAITSIFSFILVVIFHISDLVFLGPLAWIILMVSVAYAIAKYGLFNLKVAAAQFFTATLWVILLSKIFVSTSREEQTVDIFIFSISIIFGILLVRSILKEIKQREMLESLTNKLELANQDLHRLDQTKTEFISIASHQLRAPLTVIKGYISLIIEGTLGAISSKVKESLGKAAYSTEQLIKLVNDLLNLSRMESGKIEYKFAVNNISIIIKEVIAELKPQADEGKTEIRIEPKDNLEQFIFDRDKISEVIFNILHNAIKYASGGKIIIRQQVIGRDGKEYIRVSVHDNGIGIAKEDLHRLFTKFIRTEQAREMDINGLGLGLFFVKKVAEDHGGRVWVESEGIGKGSTFFVEIPFKH